MRRSLYLIFYPTHSNIQTLTLENAKHEMRLKKKTVKIKKGTEPSQILDTIQDQPERLSSDYQALAKAGFSNVGRPVEILIWHHVWRAGRLTWLGSAS